MQVWEKYATAAKLLLKQNAGGGAGANERPLDGKDGAAKGLVGGKVLASTIAENSAMMMELLGLQKRKFKPSIPNLVYQYSIYTNYTSALLEKNNPEIPSDDDY